MKKLIIIQLYSLLGFFTYSQQWTWAKQTNDGSSAGTAITIDVQGNVYALLDHSGNSSSINKYDATGNLIWSYPMLKALSYDISIDKLSNIYITGSAISPTFCGSSNTISPASNGVGSSFLCKYNSSGNVIWVKTWGDAAYGGCGKTIKTDGFGNSYVTDISSAYISSGGIWHSINRFSINKFDSIGNTIWSFDNNWHGSISPSSACLDNLGNYYVTGIFYDTAYFNSSTILLSNSSQHSIFIVKYNKYGGLVWAKKSGTGYDESNSIAVDANSNLLLTGYASNGSTFGNISLTGAAPGGMFISKYDSLGNIIWAKRENVKFGRGIISDVSGNIFVTGVIQHNSSNNTASGSIGSPSNTIVFNSQKGGDFFVAKYDQNGNVLWGKMPSGTYGDGNWSNYIYSDNNNNVYVTGKFNSSTILGNTNLYSPYTSINYDFFLAKIKDSVQQIITYVSPETRKENSFSLFPNPTSGLFKINCPGIGKFDLNISITNSMGQKVYIESHPTFEGDYSKVLDIGKLSKGIYFVEVNTGEARTVKKVVLE